MCDALALYNIFIPELSEDDHLSEVLVQEMETVNNNLKGRSTDELVNAPEATEGIEVLRLLWGLWTPLYLFSKQNVSRLKLQNI